MTAPLPRYATERGSWLGPLIAALAMAGFVTTASAQGADAETNALFLSGPIILLAGMHPRLWSYLHAPVRIAMAPLPVDPARHYAHARRRHRRGFGLAVVFGTASIGLASLVPLHRPLLAFASWGWLVVFAFLVEPAAAGFSSHYGRRFEAGSPEAGLQRSLGGGWTTSEAVVHLYAPAICLAAAAALAMPGQLTLERLLGGTAPTGAHWGLMFGPLLVAAWLGARARGHYVLGFFESVPWLAEATRTLEGPPIPMFGGLLARVPSPLVRLRLLQAWRLTPAPTLRLVVGLALPVGLVAGVVPLDPIAVGLALALVAVWLVPLGALRDAAREDARALAALPLPRRRAHEWLAAAVLASPAVVAATLLGLAWGLQ